MIELVLWKWLIAIFLVSFEICECALMGLLTLVHPDGLSAGVAELCEDGVEAGQAVGATVAHYVPKGRYSINWTEWMNAHVSLLMFTSVRRAGGRTRSRRSGACATPCPPPPCTRQRRLSAIGGGPLERFARSMQDICMRQCVHLRSVKNIERTPIQKSTLFD